MLPLEPRDIVDERNESGEVKCGPVPAHPSLRTRRTCDLALHERAHFDSLDEITREEAQRHRLALNTFTIIIALHNHIRIKCWTFIKRARGGTILARNLPETCLRLDVDRIRSGSPCCL